MDLRPAEIRPNFKGALEPRYINLIRAQKPPLKELKALSRDLRPAKGAPLAGTTLAGAPQSPPTIRRPWTRSPSQGGGRTLQVAKQITKGLGCTYTKYIHRYILYIYICIYNIHI